MNVDILPPSGVTGTAEMEPTGWKKKGSINLTSTMFRSLNTYYVQTILYVGIHLILIATLWWRFDPNFTGLRILSNLVIVTKGKVENQYTSSVMNTALGNWAQLCWGSLDKPCGTRLRIIQLNTGEAAAYILAPTLYWLRVPSQIVSHPQFWVVPPWAWADFSGVRETSWEKTERFRLLRWEAASMLET